MWSQFDFLSPGAPFGAVKDYCARYERAEDGPARLREALQYPSLSSPLLHREKREVLQSLPAPSVAVHALPMTRAQATEEARIVAGEKEPLRILNALQKLYQHPALLSDTSEVSLSPQAAVAASPKLAKCIEILRGVQQAGEKALVFTL